MAWLERNTNYVCQEKEVVTSIRRVKAHSSKAYKVVNPTKRKKIDKNKKYHKKLVKKKFHK